MGKVLSMGSTQHPLGGRYLACLFDMDGVLTDTASTHAAAWKATFDAFFAAAYPDPRDAPAPFDIEEDYLATVDGKAREDGVRDFLASRGIHLPEGSPEDDQDQRTTWGVANRKDRYFHEVLRRDGVRTYDDAVALVRDLRANHVLVGVVSASQNTRTVLRTAGILELFDTVVDAAVVRDEHLSGKPAPDAFLAGARNLRIPAVRSVVLEDALAGVEAGRRGGFGLVVGVDRSTDGSRGRSLLEHGADIVSRDLTELVSGHRRSLDERSISIDDTEAGTQPTSHRAAHATDATDRGAPTDVASSGTAAQTSAWRASPVHASTHGTTGAGSSIHAQSAPSTGSGGDDDRGRHPIGHTNEGHGGAG